MRSHHLLLVEDDELTRNLLKAYLEKEDFSVSCAVNGREMTALIDRRNFDLVFLDLNLPDEDGLSLARRLRSRSAVPLIVLTARQDKEDRIAALEIGADDYLTKPFDPLELVLRARNLLDRIGADGARNGADDVKQFKGWKLDIGSRTLRSPEGRPVPLTRSEFNLLTALVAAPKRVLSRPHLLDAIASGSDSPSDRTVDVTISRLRRKIESDPSAEQFIVTVPGLGYMFAVDMG
jgi:two-component system torCAD operon response regulator TorR